MITYDNGNKSLFSSRQQNQCPSMAVKRNYQGMLALHFSIPFHPCQALLSLHFPLNYLTSTKAICHSTLLFHLFLTVNSKHLNAGHNVVWCLWAFQPHEEMDNIHIGCRCEDTSDLNWTLSIHPSFHRQHRRRWTLRDFDDHLKELHVKKENLCSL